jgi:energy-converting hydrogenase Eha subunit G
MSAYSHFNNFNFRSAFAPRKPRHPLLRLAFGLLGLVVLCVLVFFSVFVGAAMIAAGLLYKLLRQRGKPVARDARVVDGEYRVIRKPAMPLSR